MSTMHSIRLALYRDYTETTDERNGSPPFWMIAVLVVATVAVIAGLASAGMLPSFSADDPGSLLFCVG